MPDNAKVKGRSAESSPVALRDVIGNDGDTAQDAIWSLSLLTHKQTCADAGWPASTLTHAKVSTVRDGIGWSSFKTTEELSKLVIVFETAGLKMQFVVDVFEIKFLVKTIVMLSPAR